MEYEASLKDKSLEFSPCLIKRKHFIKAHGEVRVMVHAFITSALNYSSIAFSSLCYALFSVCHLLIFSLFKDPLI